MSLFQVHICLVSQQAAPNLLPVLDVKLRPDTVVLIVSPEMTEQANALERALKDEHVNVIRQHISNAASFSEIQEVLLNLLPQFDGKNLALNLTGGTKWMALAALETLRADNRPAFYVNLNDDIVRFLGKDSAVQEIADHPLAQRITLPKYLRAHGYELVSGSKQGLQEHLKQLCQIIVRKVSIWESAIGQLNFIASNAKDARKLSISLGECRIHTPDPFLPALISELYHADLIDDNKIQQINFKNEQALDFANGGWLETYTNSKLNELRSDGILQDSAMLNVEIRNPNGTKNELDVAFMARNLLHIIECKTSRMDKDANRKTAQNALYKLDSISSIGGIGTRSMLVSYRPLNDGDEQRARDLRIRVIKKDQLIHLKEHLANWIKS